MLKQTKSQAINFSVSAVLQQHEGNIFPYASVLIATNSPHMNNTAIPSAVVWLEAYTTDGRKCTTTPVFPSGNLIGVGSPSWTFNAIFNITDASFEDIAELVISFLNVEYRLKLYDEGAVPAD